MVCVIAAFARAINMISSFTPQVYTMRKMTIVQASNDNRTSAFLVHFYHKKFDSPGVPPNQSTSCQLVEINLGYVRTLTILHPL